MLYCTAICCMVEMEKPSLPSEILLYINKAKAYKLIAEPSLPYEILLYINTDVKELLKNTPSLPYEILLYINRPIRTEFAPPPSLPYEILLYINLNQWHYRLLQNFNHSTNEESVILIHLYFRHYCQGP